MKKIISRVYKFSVLDRPLFILLLFVFILGFSLYFSKDFKLDASADTLILENDVDLKILREINERYQIKDFLVITFTPEADLFSQNSLELLKDLRNRLQSMKNVDSVITLLDIPLLQTSGLKLSEVTAGKILTLEDPETDILWAKEEILESPIYRNLILSPDGQTTGIQVNLKTDEQYSKLSKTRNRLLEKKGQGTLSPQESLQLKQCQSDYEAAYESFTRTRHRDIAAIRDIMKDYADYGTLYLGGVPMISDDTIAFVRKDLIVFGVGVLMFIVGTLLLVFREVRWMVLPLLSCFFAVIVMIGLLGFVGWKVTVLSSNFISLMLILTLSMNIHLAVRYKQLLRLMPHAVQLDVVFETVRRMVWPCLYTALTTILAFSSLVLSGIKPVIDFGWMMTIGLTVTFLTSFLLFPAVLVLLQRSNAGTAVERESIITRVLANISLHHGNKVMIVAGLLAVISLYGVFQLKVENGFINYFSKKTEIYQGMKLIDDKLGGTFPLEVILKFEPMQVDVPDDDFPEDEFGWDAPDEDPADYWFTPYKIDKIKQVHDYLDALPETGKVRSIASIVRTVEKLNDGQPFSGLELGVINKKIPENIRREVIDPYVSVPDDEARISIRILDSLEGLRRGALIEKIEQALKNKFDLGPGKAKVAGMLVLYNNMLKSLFRSQILTLGVVLLGIAVMLLVLFRSFSLALMGIIPNLLAVGIVLGIMGLMDIPLDLMTITIAAITMGIAIDNSIHYIYRFQEEFAKNNDYEKTLQVCHRNIGRAIVNTSITIIFGFSILVLSNFIPTIYFGVLTGIAMLIAMLAILSLMPRLILWVRPF